jgi:hypothetical protein
MTFAHSTTTPEAGLEGDLLYLGSGGEGDHDGENAQCKIVLAELSYAPRAPSTWQVTLVGDRNRVPMRLSVPCVQSRSSWGSRIGVTGQLLSSAVAVRSLVIQVGAYALAFSYEVPHVVLWLAPVRPSSCSVT